MVLQTKASAKYFPHSSENHSINGILLNCVQDDAEKKLQGKQDSTNEVRFRTELSCSIDWSVNRLIGYSYNHGETLLRSIHEYCHNCVVTC